MLLVFVLLYLLNSVVCDEDPFVLFSGANQATTPEYIALSALGSVEARRTGVASADLLASSRGVWPKLKLDPFQMPKRSLTMVISGLSSDDVSTAQKFDSKFPSLRAKASYESSNFFVELLKGRNVAQLAASNVVVSSAAVDCAVANALLKRSMQNASKNARCDVPRDVLTLIDELNRYLAPSGSTVSCQASASGFACRVVDDSLPMTSSFSFSLNNNYQSGMNALVAELLLVLRLGDSSVDNRVHSIITVLSEFHNLVGEERSAALLLATRTLSVVGCGNGDAACAVVSPGFNLHAKRAIAAADETNGLQAHVFHSVLWTSVFLVVLMFMALCVMHSISGDIEKDPLLYRNTHSGMFDHTLELRR